MDVLSAKTLSKSRVQRRAVLALNKYIEVKMKTQVEKESMHMYKWYTDFYRATKDSKAYFKFCEAVYGKNFSQHGFSDIKQLQKLLEVAKIEQDDIILDLGCGNGLMAEYISDLTDAHVFGIDYIPEAIKQAQDRTINKKHRLTFKEGCIGEKQFPPEFFDVIISIDTIFSVMIWLRH
jgi:cyclopropane fatty-acyl-phospholipid synthase-like methyltransferase